MTKVLFLYKSANKCKSYRKDTTTKHPRLSNKVHMDLHSRVSNCGCDSINIKYNVACYTTCQNFYEIHYYHCRNMRKTNEAEHLTQERKPQPSY